MDTWWIIFVPIAAWIVQLALVTPIKNMLSRLMPEGKVKDFLFKHRGLTEKLPQARQ